MKRLLIPFKILLSLVCLYWAVTHLDFHSTKKLFYSQNTLLAFGLGVLMAGVQTTLGSIRFGTLLKNAAYPIRFWEAMQIAWIGGFFSQAAFSMVSGDAMRIWFLVQSKLTLKRATYFIMIDRGLGLLALLLLSLGCIPFLFQMPFIPNLLPLLIGLAIIGLFSIFVLYFAFKKWGYKIQNTWVFELLLLSKQIFSRSFQSTILIALFSFLIHICNVIAVYLFMKCFDVPIGFIECAIVMLPAMLMVMLPISIGGWGVRESVLIFGFGFFGVPAETALTVSILWGLALLVSLLPGSFLFLLKHQTPITQITDEPIF